MKRAVVIDIISFSLIFLFVYTAINKIIEFEMFTRQMKNQPVPEWLTRQLVWMVPGSELIAALLLAFNTTRTKGLIVSVGLMLTFTFYVAAVLVKAFTFVPCSCGGIFKTMSWEVHLVVNIVFLAMAVVAFCLSRAGRKKIIHRDELA